MNESLSAIIFISLGILFVPFLSKLLRIPVAVGEILYGIVIGKSTLNLIHPGQWLDFLSSFGFLLLMFVAGLEVKLKEINALPLKTKTIYLLMPITIFTLSFIAGNHLHFPSIVSIALGVVSVGIVVSVLREKNLLSTPLGKTLFNAGIVGEVTSILILTFYTLYSKFHFHLEFWIGLFKLTIYLIIARLVLIFLKSFVWWFPNRFKFFFEKNPSEIGVRISLTIMFMLSVAASIIHIEPIIGAFIAGMIFSTVFEETESIEEKLSGISFGFLIPIFFIYVGLKFQIPHLSLQTIELLIIITVLAILIKTLSSLFLILEGFKIKEAVASGLLLSAPLTLVVVTAELGKELKLINEEMESILILFAILTGILAPILFNLLVKEKESESGNS